MPPLSFGHFPRERGKTEWVEGDGSVRPSGLLVGADYLLRIRALESQSHSGRVVDLRCVLTYPQLLAGTVADRFGQASDAYTIHVSSLPQTVVSLFDCRYPCVKGALTLDAAILLGAGADGRRRWRLVVIVVHMLWDVKWVFRVIGNIYRVRCLNWGFWDCGSDLTCQQVLGWVELLRSDGFDRRFRQGIRFGFSLRFHGNDGRVRM